MYTFTKNSVHGVRARHNDISLAHENTEYSASNVNIHRDGTNTRVGRPARCTSKYIHVVILDVMLYLALGHTKNVDSWLKVALY